MANVDPPAISTPSRPRYSLNPKRSGTFPSSGAANAPNVAGFSPGGQVFEGYSYLSRSNSMSTSTRSRPKGLQSRTSDVINTPPSAPRNLPSCPSSPSIPRAANSPASSPLTATVDLPQRSKTIHRLPSSISTPELHTISITHPPRSESESERLAEAVANLPHSPKSWLPSQVALYLTHVLGLVPRPVVEDVTAYVRSSRMGGRAFLRLSEKDLERQGLNLKWRKLMIEAVRKLRRDALRGRIWGYESGSLRWPKSAQDLEREEAEEEDAEEEDEQQDGIIRNSKTTSKLTLKRMRDSRKVRGMIQAFQTSPEKEDAAASCNLPIDPIYGRGYVRGQAQQILSEAEQKKLSLRRPLRARRSTADFPWLESLAAPKKEDIEALLASLTEQEADQLANELGIADLHDTQAVGKALQDSHADPKSTLFREASGDSVDEVMQMPTLTRHGSADSAIVDEGDTSVSDCSGTASELEYEDQSHTPRYGVLDDDIIRAIMADDGDSAEQQQEVREEVGAFDHESPKNELTRSHTTGSILRRPGRPYRASLYTEDELAALDNDGLHTRTESSRELVELSSDVQELAVVEPDFGTARLRSAEDVSPAIPSFEASSSSSSSPPRTSSSSTPAASGDEYVFTLPDPPLLKTGSIRRTPSRKATFGSKRGKAVLSLLQADTPHNDLFASLPGATMLRQKSSNAAAEEDGGWGGTLGRSSSRKNLNSVFDTPSNFHQRRGLDRVASEAEGEAFAAKIEEMEKQEEQEEQEVGIEKAAGRYEETVLSEADCVERGLDRRTSVEQRLSKLFNDAVPTVEASEGAMPSKEDLVLAESEIEEGSGKVVDTVDPAISEDAGVAVSADPEGVTALDVGDEPTTVNATESPDSVPEATAIAEHEAVSELPTEPAQEKTAESAEAVPSDEAAASGETTDVSEPVLPSLSVTSEEAETELEKDAVHSTEPSASILERHLETSTDPFLPTVPTLDTVSPSAPVSQPSHTAGEQDQDGEEEEPFELVSVPSTLDPSNSATETLPSTSTATSDAHSAPTTSPFNKEEDAESKLLVPLTVLEPHPSGTGSIKKRSMVLVDRKRFESLARRMTDLEAQLESIDHRASSANTTQYSRASSSGGNQTSGGGGLRDMFSQTETQTETVENGSRAGMKLMEDEEELLESILASTCTASVGTDAGGAGGTRVIEQMQLETGPLDPSATTPTSATGARAGGGGGWRTYLNPSSWATYLSSLNPYYSQQHPTAETAPSATASTSAGCGGEEEELSLYALLGRSESEQEKHLLSIGAIPAYMLGLGAGVGFVLVREVLGKGLVART